jgi:hypothetical protein
MTLLGVAGKSKVELMDLQKLSIGIAAVKHQYFGHQDARAQQEASTPKPETTMRGPHRLLPTFAVNALTAGTSVPMRSDGPIVEQASKFPSSILADVPGCRGALSGRIAPLAPTSPQTPT